MTIRDMWEDYERRSTMAGESAKEIAFQKIGYVCGAVATLGNLSRGVPVEFDQEEVSAMLDEAFEHAKLDIESAMSQASKN